MMLSSSRASSIAIRFATLRDLACMATLFDAYRVFYGLASDPRAASAFLGDRLARDESVVLLATLGPPSPRDQEAVGLVQLYRNFSSLSLGFVIVLNDLFVVPDARRLGIGSRLVDAAASYARQSGALRLELEVHPDNEPALRLYREKGFVADTEFARLSLSLGNVPTRNA
jgi:ribosomal protein S18 acetylase RimI-like enzyme